MAINDSMYTKMLRLVVLLIPLLACRAFSPQLAPDKDAPGEEHSSSSSSESIEIELEVGPGDFNFPDPRMGLGQLNSYKEMLIVSFEGNESGQASSWSSMSILVVTNDPPARLLTIENTGDIYTSDPALLAIADDAFFKVEGNGVCNVARIDPENPMLNWLEPAGMLSGILGAEEAGQEELNGQAASRYTFDERSILQSGIAKSVGEVWVARDGGYILKYSVTTTGNADTFGEGIQGTMNWEYTLTDINQPLTLDLPQSCLEGMVDAPRLPDSTNVVNLRGWLGFDTLTSIPEAASYYQEQLPALGWKLAFQPIIGDTAILEFIRADQTLSVIIGPGEAGTRVDIVLDRQEE